MKDRSFEEGSLPDGSYYFIDLSANKFDPKRINYNDPNVLVTREGNGSENDPFSLVGGQHILQASLILYHLSELRNTPIWFKFQEYTIHIDAKNQEQPAKIVGNSEVDIYTEKNLKMVLSSIFEDREAK